MSLSRKEILDAQQFLTDIKMALKIYDKATATAICNELVQYIFQRQIVYNYNEVTCIEKVLQELRNKLMFAEIISIAKAFLQMGNNSFKIRRQYYQALIATGDIIPAIALLDKLIEDTLIVGIKAQRENFEAWGLRGRAYKQLYINANASDSAVSTQYLINALDSYYHVYRENPEEGWHGINVVALLCRAKRDNIEILNFMNADEIANDILETIDSRNAAHMASPWDFVTASEACLALGQLDDALEWMSGYLRIDYIDAFEISSTLRQFEEVWQLNMESNEGRLLLPLLKSALMQKGGMHLLFDISDVVHQKKYEKQITEKYEHTIKNITNGAVTIPEKILGRDTFNTYRWYMLEASRCLAVARIGRDETQGYGTGFLLRGHDLHDDLKGEYVLLTNAHVVSENRMGNDTLRPDQAVITFEAADQHRQVFTIKEIIWSSPFEELDTTIIRFSEEDQKKIQNLVSEDKLYPIAVDLPIYEQDNKIPNRIYIIGHPRGGTLQISLQDNLFLGYTAPKLRYNTPTEEGSSGSPVFDKDWKLIGIHHAYVTVPKPLSSGLIYHANEGLWIQAIKNALPASLKTGAAI